MLHAGRCLLINQQLQQWHLAQLWGCPSRPRHHPLLVQMDWGAASEPLSASVLEGLSCVVPLCLLEEQPSWVWLHRLRVSL